MNRRFTIVTAIVGLVGIGLWWWLGQTTSRPPEQPAEVSTSAETASGASEENPAESQPAPASSVAEARSETALDRILAALPPADRRKLTILDEVLRSKNDNDPRLDTELKDLSPEMKRALRQYYATFQPEKRNELGTIAFLTARSMSSRKDVEFLKSIVMEKPCRSLADCSRDPPPPSAEELHVAGITETTLNYPQLTVLRQSLQQYRLALGAQPPNSALAESIVGIFREATNSNNQRVAEEAQMILKHLKK